jgi:hypothetical protein
LRAGCGGHPLVVPSRVAVERDTEAEPSPEAITPTG